MFLNPSLRYFSSLTGKPELKANMQLLFNLIFITAHCIKIHHAELLMSQVICRHGDRNPEIYVPNEYGDFYGWRNDLGHLTSIGMNQAHLVGEYLRRLYIKTNFTLPYYHPLQVKVFSTNKDRTKQTAQVATSAMFSPVHGKFKYRPYIRHLHVPYTVFDFDMGVDWNLKCPVYAQYLRKHSRDYEQEANRTFNQSVKIRICFTQEHLHNITRPWVNQTVIDTVQFAARSSLKNLLNDRQMVKLRIGAEVKYIFDNFKDALELKDTKSKFNFFAAHDISLYSIFALFRYDPEPPKIGYCAFLRMELHRLKKNLHYFKFYYFNGTYEREPKIRKLEKDITKDICGLQLCPVKVFFKKFSDVLNVDYQQECSSLARRSRISLTVILTLMVFFVGQ
ncbi:hypothetical protein ACOME3_004242 [Neoechinorhynchus agilis]